jgi:transposase
MPNPQPLVLSKEARAELEAIARSAQAPPSVVKRARLIIALADGATYAYLTSRWGLAATSISRWKRRFAMQGIAGLADAPRSGRPARLDPTVDARIVALTREAPPAPSTQWSVRRMARTVGVSPSTVQRVWARLGLSPQHFASLASVPLILSQSLVFD